MTNNAVPFPFYIRIWHWGETPFSSLSLSSRGPVALYGTLSIIPDYALVVALHKYAGYVLTLFFLFWIAAYVIVGGFTAHYSSLSRT
jgi:thiosulfate reductase cytochrome b subunit